MVVGESVWDNHKFEITGTKCDKIDNKKLESCLTSLYGDLNWSWESNSSNIPRVKYLSTNGIPIVEDDLNHFRMFERVLEEFYKNSSNEDTSVVKDYFSFEQIKENNQLDEKFKYNESKIVDKFINLTGVVRLNLHSKTPTTLHSINVESYHTLTDLQRRFLLDIIQKNQIDLNKIYVDDWSEEQMVRRQLGIYT